MTYVIVAYWRPREGQAEKIEAILRDLAAAARQEPGNLEFIVNRSHGDPNEFLLYEQYKDDDAIEAHRAAAHFLQYVKNELPKIADRIEGNLYEPLG